MSHRICRFRLCLIFAVLLIFALLGVAGSEAFARSETARSSGRATQLAVPTEDGERGVSDASPENMDAYYRNLNLHGIFNSQDTSSKGCNTCTVANLDKIPNNQCRKTYENIYNKTEPIDIRVMIGYMDNRAGNFQGNKAYLMGKTQDKYLQAAMIERFTRQEGCTAQYNDCGFELSPDRMTLVRTVMGPDQKEHTVRLTIASSSASDDDRSNRAGGADGQRQLENTKRNEDLFYGGFRNADALLYVGHMRKGGGPDFGPPPLLANGHVNYPKLVNERNLDIADRNAGRNQGSPPRSKYMKMLKAAESAQGAGRSPALVGILACDSDKLASDMKGALPQSGVALSSEIIFEAAYLQATALVDSVLNFRCDDQMDKMVNANLLIGKQVVAPIQDIGMVRRTQTRAPRAASGGANDPNEDPGLAWSGGAQAGSSGPVPYQPYQPPAYQPAPLQQRAYQPAAPAATALTDDEISAQMYPPTTTHPGRRYSP